MRFVPVPTRPLGRTAVVLSVLVATTAVPAAAADTDGDRLGDGAEVRGFTIRQQVTTKQGTSRIGFKRTNPVQRDTDRDGLTDRAEITGSANTRHDRRKTDPVDYDTDDGRVNDGREVRLGSDPSNVRSSPSVPFPPKRSGPRSARTLG